MKSKSLAHGVLMIMTMLLTCLWLAPLVELGAAESSAENNAENAIKKLYARQETAETLSKNGESDHGVSQRV